KRRHLLVAGVVAIALLTTLVGLWAGGVFRPKTQDGTIIIENLPADADVLVDGEKVTPAPKESRADNSKQIAVDTDGFVPLFNGKDLKGWKESTRSQGGQMFYKDGALTITAPDGKPANFVTERLYADFHIRAEVRRIKGRSGNIFLRYSDSQN